MKTIKLLGLLAVMTGLMYGCSTVPRGATKTVQISTAQLQASGAGIIRADLQNTVIKIKCGVCGFESEEITIPTPQAGKPYTLNWVCPKCGHKQTVIIKLV